MNQEFKVSQKLQKWQKWMKAIEKEIYGLVVDANMFWEVQDIIRANPRIQKPSAFYRYLGRTYLSHALAGLRRQIKPKKNSIFLERHFDTETGRRVVIGTSRQDTGHSPL